MSIEVTQEHPGMYKIQLSNEDYHRYARVALKLDISVAEVVKRSIRAGYVLVFYAVEGKEL